MGTGARTGLASPAAVAITSAVSFIGSGHSLLGRHLYLSKPSLSSTRFSSNRVWSTAIAKRLVAPYQFRAGAVPFIGGGGGAILQDAGASVMLMVSAYGLVSSFDYLSQRNLIEQSLSRKLVHILSGLFYVASWPIFRTYKICDSRRKARVNYPITLFITLHNDFLLQLYSIGDFDNYSIVMPRRELLRGPLYYVLILILCSLVFWRESPTGVISLAMMCGGDGVADIMGRRFGSLKIPYNPRKSWAGSISMFIFGFSISIGMLYYFSVLGYFQLDWVWAMGRVALVSLVATVVESLPITGVVDDNISVPLASMLISFFIFGY